MAYSLNQCIRVFLEVLKRIMIHLRTACLRARKESVACRTHFRYANQVYHSCKIYVTNFTTLCYINLLWFERNLLSFTSCSC